MACNMLSSLDINESQLHLVKEDKLKKFFKVYIHLCKVQENANWCSNRKWINGCLGKLQRGMKKLRWGNVYCFYYGSSFTDLLCILSMWMYCMSVILTKKALKRENWYSYIVSIQSVASIGNTLNSVHLAVEAIQKTVDEHKKTLESLQSSLVRSVNMRERQHAPAHRFLCQSRDPRELSRSYSACFKKTKTKQNKKSPTSNVYSLVCHLYIKPWIGLKTRSFVNMVTEDLCDP